MKEITLTPNYRNIVTGRYVYSSSSLIKNETKKMRIAPKRVANIIGKLKPKKRSKFVLNHTLSAMIWCVEHYRLTSFLIIAYLIN